MSNSTNIISNIVTQKKYKEKYHWTDFFSYFYLLLGVFLMFWSNYLVRLIFGQD